MPKSKVKHSSTRSPIEFEEKVAEPPEASLFREILFQRDDKTIVQLMEHDLEVKKTMQKEKHGIQGFVQRDVNILGFTIH